MNLYALPGEPFDCVFDVGGNVGAFAEIARTRWPESGIVSFEPVPQLADANRHRASGRWKVEQVGVSDTTTGLAMMYVCQNQHEASTMMEPGTARRREYGIVDSFAPIQISTVRLDAYRVLAEASERLLVKVDVEGHELAVLQGAPRVLAQATTVVVEVQNDPTVFIGSATPYEVDEELRAHGLRFAGLAGCLVAPSGRVLQYDGVWTR